MLLFKVGDRVLVTNCDDYEWLNGRAASVIEADPNQTLWPYIVLIDRRPWEKPERGFPMNEHELEFLNPEE